LAYSLEGPLRPNEITRVAQVMATERPDGQEPVFEWMTGHYGTITSRIPTPFHPYLTRMAGGCSDSRMREARVFFADPAHKVEGTEKELEKVAAQSADCVSLRKRELASVAGFLKGPGKAQ
jgi:alanyl aminopeptidase